MNTTPSSARNALRRLLILIAVAVGFVLFSYGWTVTDINLDEPQEARRQQNVQSALRELFSPNIFVQEYDIVRVAAPFLIQCPAGEEAPASEPQTVEGGGSIVISPTCGMRGDEVTITGTGFAPDTLAQVRWTPEEGDSRPRPILNTGRETFDVGHDGTFEVRIEVPSIRGSTGETHLVEVDVRTPVGLPSLSNTTHEVINKMIETIFLALIATAISIPPSVILSFFAARNLMKPVRLSLGNLLVSIALLPVGAVLGAVLLGPLGQFAVNLGKGALFSGEAALPSIVLGFASVTASQTLRRRTVQEVTFTDRVRSALMSVVVAIAAVFVLGLLGGLGVFIGRLADTGVAGYISNFIGTLGELVELLIVPIAAVIGAFSLSSIGNALTMDALKHVDTTISHVLGFLLGAVAGALVIIVMALIATQGALFGLLPPIVAAFLGAQVLPMLYNRFVLGGNQRRPGQPEAFRDQSIRTVLSFVGAVIVFYFTFVTLNVGKALVEGVLPRETTIPILGLEVSQYLVRAGMIGAVLGAIMGGLAGTRATFPIGDVLYNTTRTILNALRSIEPLIMGLVFVIWVGIGPFAGVLALTLHSIASLGKLYSEQLENIDSGPIEALESTGANRLQTIMYGAVPQIIPPYIAFTMYRWDINVRMSTIIGFVGGGGIGFLLQQQLNLLRYRDAGVAVLAIAIVVSILDYASATIREHYM